MGLCRCLSGDTADSSGLPPLTGNENSLIYRLLSPLNPLLEIKINMRLLFPSAPDISVEWQSIVRGCANEIPLQRRAGENLLGSVRQPRPRAPEPCREVVPPPSASGRVCAAPVCSRRDEHSPKAEPDYSQPQRQASCFHPGAGPGTARLFQGCHRLALSSCLLLSGVIRDPVGSFCHPSFSPNRVPEVKRHRRAKPACRR